MQGFVGVNRGTLVRTASLLVECANIVRLLFMEPPAATAYLGFSEKMENLLAYHVPKTPRVALDHRSVSATQGSTPRTALLLARVVQQAQTPRVALEHHSASATQGSTPRTALPLARLVQQAHSTTTWVPILAIVAADTTGTIWGTFLVIRALATFVLVVLPGHQGIHQIRVHIVHSAITK